MKKTFDGKEVIELIRFYCDQQRILCQLPVPGRQFGITDEINEQICHKIRNADIEILRPLSKENFGEILSAIKNQ